MILNSEAKRKVGRPRGGKNPESIRKYWRQTALRAVEKLRQVAHEEGSPAKGGFLYAFLLAFERADNENALIMLPAMRKICKKYELVRSS